MMNHTYNQAPEKKTTAPEVIVGVVANRVVNARRMVKVLSDAERWHPL